MTPAASVGVATMILILPALKASSTMRRCSILRPAWWNAAPLETYDARSSERLVFSPRTLISAETFWSSARARLERRPANAEADSLARLMARLRLSTKMRDWPPSTMAFSAILRSPLEWSGLRLLTRPSLNMMLLLSATPSLSSTGLHPVAIHSASSHSATSSAFLMVALRARICRSGFICLSLARATSRVGPRSPPMRCISSATTREIPPIQGVLCLSRESHFSFVVMTMSYPSSQGVELSRSPVLMPILIFRPSRLSTPAYAWKVSYFSHARARRGVM